MRTLWPLLLLACTAQAPPEQAAAPPTAPPPPPLVIKQPEAWSRDIRASEAAADALDADIAQPLCHALKTEDPPALRGVLAPGARGRWWAAPERVTADPAVRVDRFAASEVVLEREALAAALLENRKQFAVLERCSLKPFRYLLSEPRQEEGWTRLAFDLAGRDAEGHALTWHADWDAEVVLTADGWRLRAVTGGTLQAVTVLAAPFQEVAAEVGLGLHRDEAAREAITWQADDQRLETMGGVGVIDFNADGFPDVLAWNRRRTLQLFLNDGRGGFTKRTDLIPPYEVGHQQLWLDLDGDGREELVSSELVSCSHDRGRFPIFQRVDGSPTSALKRAGSLEFHLACVDPSRALYQHIAASDVNHDGRIDLLVSGFGNHLSRRGAFNHFDGQNGERNLLFINQGGLQFKEEGVARGLRGTRFSYVSAFFDLEGDGDDDLYVANDFGPNELYTNDGQGFFAAVTQGPMVENGQSMGLTVGDFDGDLKLDLYVSNMYSKAGQRIVPLAEGRLKPETYHALAGLAAGNALYTQSAEGFASKAQDLRIAKAGWAWGQALFDVDNDGDRDLFVVNGMTSHSTIKEKDF